MDAVKTIKHNGHTIDIHIDQDALSPRANDNIAEFHCSHRLYDIGDKGFNYFSGGECIDVANEARKQGDIVLPLYMLDHSGITISLSPFSCPWDSGQVGFVIVRREKMLKEFSGKIFTKRLKEKAIEIAKSEVEEYDQYVRGEVYGYVIDDYVDSCWGFFGLEECIEEAKASAEFLKV